MPHFFFDLDEDGDVTADQEGRILPDLEGARAQAVREARDLMCGDILRGNLCLACAIRVRDEAGETVLTLTFDDAVERSGSVTSRTGDADRRET